MPNWVTVKIKTQKEILEYVKSDKSEFDFNNIIKFPGDFEINLISLNVENEAKRIVGFKFSEHPLLASLEKINRLENNFSKLSENDFKNLIKMLKNYRRHGYFHQMDFAVNKWGTKWNACEVQLDLDNGICTFQTAWSCPNPILETLSKKFPESVINVEYADEDIGSNCGLFSLQNGLYLTQDIAPPYSQRTKEEMEKWKKYACVVSGRDYNDYKEDLNEELE